MGLPFKGVGRLRFAIRQHLVRLLQRLRHSFVVLRTGSGDEVSASWWEALPALAQGRLVQRLIERVDYDGVQGTVAITFAADAAHAVAEQQALRREETKA